MKSFLNSCVRLAALSLLVAVACVAARGQTTAGAGKLEIGYLDRLAPQASETVDVNLDERLLKLVTPALSSKEPDEDNTKKMIAGLKGIYVKSFDFDMENQYTDADVNPVREQLRSPGWSRIVEVRSRRENMHVEVYILTNGNATGDAAGRIDGLAILAFGPKNLTVVNIVGAVDLERLSKLEGQFGVPELDLERDNNAPPKKH